MLERVLAAINTPGARILICLGLLVGYSVWTGSSNAHDVVVFAMGVLAREMGARNEKVQPEVTSSQTVTVETAKGAEVKTE